MLLWNKSRRVRRSAVQREKHKVFFEQASGGGFSRYPVLSAKTYGILCIHEAIRVESGLCKI